MARLHWTQPPEKNYHWPCVSGKLYNKVDNILQYWNTLCCHHFVAYRCPPVKSLLANKGMRSACCSAGTAFAPHHGHIGTMDKAFLRRGRKNMSTSFNACMLTHLKDLFFWPSTLPLTTTRGKKKSVSVPTNYEKPVESIRDCSSALYSQEELLRVTYPLSKNILSMQKETLGQKSPSFFHLGA